MIGKIGILDTNIYIYLSKLSNDEVRRSVLYITSFYKLKKIWIPRYVKDELMLDRNKRIQRVLEILELFGPVEPCPLKNNRVVKKIKKGGDIDLGESDVIMQIVEFATLPKSRLRKYSALGLDILFFTNDLAALRCSFVNAKGIYWRKVAEDIRSKLGIPIEY